MTVPTYTQTSWVDNTAPAIDAANLNHVEGGISNVTVAWNASRTVATQTTSYTLTTSDGTVVFNGTTLTATLPDPTTVTVGRRFTIKNINASAVTVVSAGTSKKIDGAASQSVAQWAKLTVFTDGTQWLSM